MQFRLPQQLQNELVAYDPALKALARQQPKSAKGRKSKFPLGQPEELIPYEVVKKSLLDNAIEQINASSAPNRYHIFTRIKNVATPDATTVTFAILYHYESVWYAAWLPPEGKESDYIYGFSVAYKDLDSHRKHAPRTLLPNKEVLSAETESVQFGRSYFRFYQKIVTMQDVRDGYTMTGWNLPHVPTYHDKSRDISQGIRGFEEQLKKSIPTWEDCRGIFDRIRTNNTAFILFESGDLEEEHFQKLTATPDWKPSYQELQRLILAHAQHSGYRGEALRSFNKILHIIDKPFFRKWIQERCEEVIAKAVDPDSTTLRSVKRPWSLIFAYLQRIDKVHQIWPDCPIDYYQTHINVLIGTQWHVSPSYAANEWIRENMPVASFFNNLTKFYEEKSEEADRRGSSYYYSTHLARSVYRFQEWDDTCSMISTLLNHHVEVPIPKRWRMEEFHDAVQAEAWKIKNPNEKLPQDLFPTPIKVKHEEALFTFFQPHDTHQLALWGQAVRNCIGSASGYAEGVRKKKHFLVLCMVDQKPRFTVQLDVNMGMMSVKQIVSLSNSQLSLEERELYSKTFGEALKLREEELIAKEA